MSKADTTENDVIKIMFRSSGNDPAYRTQANLYLALHTADPGESGDQTTSEATYTNYNRVAVTKDAAGWDISGNQASNAAIVQFPICQGGSNTITHVSIGLVAGKNNASQILYSGQLNDSLSVSNLIQPQFAVGALTITED